MTSCSQGLSPNDKGRQRRESLGTRLDFEMTGDCCVFKFLRHSVEGKDLMRFQSECFILKFLKRSVDGA